MSEARPDLTRLRIDRSSQNQRRRGGWLVAVVLVFALGYLAWTRFGAIGRIPQVEVGRVLRVGGAQAQTGTSANGYVVARRQAALSTDVQGRLVELRVQEGDRVRRDDVLARLDTAQLEASLERARGEIAQAEAMAAWHLADHDRLAALLHSGTVGRSDYDLAKARLLEARARVETLEAAAKEIAVMIEKSSIRAPFDGIVTRKNAEVGEVVSAIGGVGADARAAIVTLVDSTTLEVQVELAQTSLHAAKVGAPVLIFLDAFPEDAYRGRVRQIWPTANRQKATVELRAEFSEPDQRILPEMGVRVVFVPDDERAAKETEVLVPKRAVMRGSPPRVFLFERGVVALRSVGVEPEDRDGLLKVTDGLQGDELVVLDPPETLRDGDAVTRTEDGA